jgi:7-cyano-7-deazaguanine reductase
MSALGQPTRFPDAYDASLLEPLPRAPQRAALGLADVLPFLGADRWTVWEAAWRDDRGRPRSAIVRFDVPATSPRIVESKSVKLYFASLNHATFASPAGIVATIARDLRDALGVEPSVRLDLPAQWSAYARRDPDGELLDDVVPEGDAPAPDRALIRCGDGTRRESLVWHGFRAVCPVTGQPDYATLHIACEGAPIDRGSLVTYLAGFRRHPGFHEHCVERIFVDLLRACAPRSLAVQASFTRRGGIDITPWRATPGTPAPEPLATFRQ